jgi:hypothetical protein
MGTIKRILLSIIFLPICACSTTMKYTSSDHYDGKTLFNPHLKDEPGWWEPAKMIIGTRKQKWPDHVENQSAIKLNSDLSRDQVAITFVK